jgi:gliding motility-associated-like protein
MKKSITYLMTLLLIIAINTHAFSQNRRLIAYSELSTNPETPSILNSTDELKFNLFSLSPQENIELPIENIRSYHNQNYYIGLMMPSNNDLSISLKYSDAKGTIAGLAVYKRNELDELPVYISYVFNAETSFKIPNHLFDSHDELVVRLWFSEPMDNKTIGISVKKEDLQNGLKAITINQCLYSPQELITDVLISGCVEAMNITSNDSGNTYGDPNCTLSLGYFVGAIGTSGFTEGFVMTSGDASLAPGPDTGTGTGYSSGTGGDPDLQAINPGYSVNDACILEFDFVPADNTVEFSYIFASEEFPEYANSSYNDVFGFFLSGPGINGPYSNNAINIALLPNGQPVTINNIYNNAAYYVGPTSGSGATGQAYGNSIEYDGASIPLVASASVTPCATYHIKLAIGDAGDSAFDSAVFFQEGSFVSGEYYSVASYNIWGADLAVMQGCETSIVFTRSGDEIPLSDPVPVEISFGGTATMGTDYSNIPTSFTIPPFQNELIVNFDAYITGNPNTTTLIVNMENGCPCTTSSSQHTIYIEPPFEINPVLTNTGPICSGESATVNLALNTPDPAHVDITWSTGATDVTSINVSPLSTTNYTVTVSYPCSTVVLTSTLTVEPDATPNFDQLGPYCLGESPDPLPTTSTNGVTGTWSPATISTASAGTTTYNFTPSGACAAPASMNITVNPNPTANAVVHGTPSCNGLSDGSIVLGVVGGTSPYTFAWNNGETTQNLLDIPAGTYDVVVTDANGCTASSSAVVGQPDPVTGNVVSVNDAICLSYGSATVEGVGGTPPFTYFWPASAGGVSGGTATELNPGSYIVTISDTYFCEGTIEVVVPQSGGINANVVNITDASCAGGSDGSIQINTSGGIPDYEFNWETGSTTGSTNPYTISNLQAGSYNITITDGNGCEYTITNVSVGQPSPLMANPINLVHVDCYGTATGSAEIQVSGGTPTYYFGWPIAGVTGNIANNLEAGTYIVTVTDANSCTVETTFSINQTDSLIVNEILQDAPCYGENGQATINITSGGNPPYSIMWEDGADQFLHDAVPPEQWFGYSITDDMGCSYSNNIMIDQPDLLEIDITGTDLNCYNNNTGSAVVTVTGGTNPYFYEWSNGILNPGISNINAGTYIVTVTDFNDCEAIGEITINQPDQLILDINTINVDCGNELGEASVNISGGIPPYQILWSTGDTIANTENLLAGNHSITVTDANGCIVSNNFEIENTNNIQTEIVVMQEILCPGELSGVLTAQSTNGVEPFSYFWSNSNTSPSISNLGAGDYQLTLTDAWGCEGYAQYNMVAPNEFQVNETIQEIICFGGNEGSIFINVTGGTPPYNMAWSSGDYGPVLTQLTSGAYNVTITDANNCQTNETYVLHAPEDDLRISAEVQNVSCYGDDNGEIHMDANGGTKPYYYNCYLGSHQFSGQHATGLICGHYRIKVTDNNGCTNESTVIVSEPSPLEASYVKTNPSCIGNNDGYFEIITEGGTSPYIYELQGITYDLPYFNDYLQGDYFVTIIDNNQCELVLGPIMLIDTDELCLRIPNAITPNSDGINDTWIIEGLDKYPSNIVRVFNRWGQLMYYGEFGAEPWDGTTLEGHNAPTGNYLYVIDLYEGELQFTGTVTVVY